MSEDQAAKVIQFPGKKNIEPAAVTPANEVQAPLPEAKAMPMPLPRGRQANLGTALGLLAILLASVAVNRYVYRPSSTNESSRGIASANLDIDRDAAWEKLLAERLAKPGSVANATQLGRAATLVEQLRFATLEDKYVIAFRPDGRSIAAISATPERSHDAVVSDRAAFLDKYGQLFDSGYAAADLKSSDRAEGKVTESYELRDKAGQVKVRAFFELDQNDQLISVRAVQI